MCYQLYITDCAVLCCVESFQGPGQPGQRPPMQMQQGPPMGNFPPPPPGWRGGPPPPGGPGGMSHPYGMFIDEFGLHRLVVRLEGMLHPCDSFIDMFSVLFSIIARVGWFVYNSIYILTSILLYFQGSSSLCQYLSQLPELCPSTHHSRSGCLLSYTTSSNGITQITELSNALQSFA